MKFTVALLATALLTAAALPAAHAEEQWCKPGGAITADQAKVMLEAMGYKVKHMGEEHGCLEAKGTDPNGKRVEVYVDSNDGKIVKIKD